MRSLHILVLTACVLLCMHAQKYEASRILSEDYLIRKELALESLQRGDVPPSGASGCTYIPGSGGSGCPSTVNEMNFAGNALPRPTPGAYPRLVVPFGVAAATQPQAKIDSRE